MLKKIFRLTKEKDFAKLAKEGSASYAFCLIIKYLKNDLAFSRFGLIVSNKVSKKASTRNLIKRRIREILRLNLKSIKTGYDILIVVSPKIINNQGQTLPYEEMEKILAEIFGKAKLLV